MRSRQSFPALKGEKLELFHSKMEDARRIAKKLYGRSWVFKGGSIEDLYQAAYIGLLGAVRKYDEKMGLCKFGSYLYKGVYYSVLNEMRILDKRMRIASKEVTDADPNLTAFRREASRSYERDLDSMLAACSPKEKAVVRGRAVGRLDRQIAVNFGISKQSVGMIRKEAITKIRLKESA